MSSRIAALLICGLFPWASAFAQNPVPSATVQDLVTRQIELYRAHPEAGQPMSQDFLHRPVRELPSRAGEVYRAFEPRSIPSDHPLLSMEKQKAWDSEFGLPVTLGNRMQVLKNKETFEEKFRLLNSAKRFVVGATMIVDCDASVEPLIQRMIERRREGIEIYLMLERFFSIGHDSCVQRLIDSGVQVAWSEESMKLSGRSFFHDKFWIQDGETALIEGPNLIDIQTDADGFNGLYRDTGVRIKGPAVTDLLEEASRLWSWLATHGKPSRRAGVVADLPVALRVEQQREAEISSELRAPREEKLESALKNLDGACRIVSQGPHRSRQAVSRLYADLIQGAQSYLAVPSQRRSYGDYRSASGRADNRLLSLLFERSKEPGFKLDFFVNFHNTPFTVAPPNPRGTPPVTRVMMTWDDLTLRGRLNHALDVFERHGGPGLEVWSYFQYFHSKHLLADQVAVVIGSFNLEKISALQSFEIALLCHDSELVRQVQEMTALDLLNSVPMLRRRSD